jgi:hypothetical protein
VGRESCKVFAASNRRGAILHSHICKKLCRTAEIHSKENCKAFEEIEVDKLTCKKW